MTFPLVPSPLGGILGAHTASFFKLDPISRTVPVEPLLDLVPGYTPFRVTFDMVDNETFSFEYDVTENEVQSFSPIVSNVRKRLEKITIQGTLSALPQPLALPLAPIPLNVPSPGAPPPPVPGSFLRLDLLRIRNLKAIADERQPIMVVTPRGGLARCFIESLVPDWNPNKGESSGVSVVVKEARLVDPLFGTFRQDFPSQTPGNNAETGGGQNSTRPTNINVDPATIDAGIPTVLT